MAHRFNDIVTLVRAGVEVPALVVQSSAQTDGEHLTVVSLDPAKESPLLSGMNVDAAIRRDFVSPLTEGRTFGWKEKAQSAIGFGVAAALALGVGSHPGQEPVSGGIFAPGNLKVPTPPLTDDEVYTQVRDKFLETEEIHPPEGSSVEQVFKAAARLTMTTVRTMQDVGDENKSLHAKIAEIEKELADADAPKPDAPAQLDEAQGPVPPGDAESPHALDSPDVPPAEPQS